MSDTSSSTPACVACGSARGSDSRTNLADLEYGVVPRLPLIARRCSDCDSEFLAPRPTTTDLIDFYPADYHAYNDDHGPIARRLVRARASGRVRYYRGLLQSDHGSLFDVGAGDCRHFDELRRTLDLECAGVELNPEVAQAGRDRGYDVADGTLEDMDLSGRAGRFDLVSMNHVLEHVIDPRAVVERAFQLLRPGGHIIGQLPSNTSWEARVFGRRWGGYHYPRHLQMFSRRGLSALLERSGFREVKVRSALHVQTALSLQNAVIGMGWQPEMRFGKSPAYNAFLLLSAPFELVAFAADRGGIVNFSAHKLQ